MKTDYNRLFFIRLFENTEFEVFSPPTGILSIISYLRKIIKDLDIVLYDMVLEGDSVQALYKKIRDKDPDIILFSLTYLERDMFFKTSQTLRTRFPEKIFIAGGPGVSSNPLEFLRPDCTDYIVQAEGEFRTVEIIRALREKREVSLDGIGFFKDNEKVFRTASTYIEDLDEIGFPAWDMTDLQRFSGLPNLNSMLKGRKYAQVITSRGCPYSCPYCQNSYLTGSVRHRKRSVQSIIKELDYLKSIGVDEIHFLDDTFNIPEDRALSILDAIARRKYGFYVAFQGIRMEKITPRILNKMKKAGTYKIEFGIQHVAPDIVSQTGRTGPNALRIIRSNIKTAKKLNILTCAYFIYGFPGETLRHSELNLKEALKTGSDMAAFLKLIPLPGTEYFSMLDSPGNIPSSQYNFYNNSEHLTLSEYSADKLKDIQKYSYKKYYTHNLRIIRTVLRLPWNLYWLRIFLHQYIRDIFALFFR
ncbi:MAG: B12-binding domain-containing radical SAM protein [Candidatus Muiribacteriaceae bacterium]